MLRIFCFFLLLSSFFYSLPLQSNPWGKDADLAAPSTPACPPPPSSPLARLGIRAIRFHQEVISPADGPRSNFFPSSSQYTLDAMRKYGFFMGYAMGCDRLMRENDDEWVYRTCPGGPRGKIMKYNPVP